MGAFGRFPQADAVGGVRGGTPTATDQVWGPPHGKMLIWRRN